MTAFEIFAIAWIPIAVAIAFSAERIEKRLGLDKPHHPAE